MSEPTQQELQDAIEYRNKIWERKEEVRKAIPFIEDFNEKARQQLRLRALMSIYKDCCDEVKRLRSYFNTKKKKQSIAKSSNIDIAMMMGNVWADLSGVTWNDLSDYTWGRDKIEPDSITNPITDFLKEVIKQGIERCTDRQRFYLCQYYGVGKTLREIGEENSVDKSVVQRTIVRGLRNISKYTSAKLLISKCIDKNGYFDYLLFVNSCEILTNRQREILFLILSNDNKQFEISKFIERNRSTVSRTLDRIIDNLNGVAVELNLDYSSIKIHKEDLRLINEKKLVEDLGLTPAFYYGVCKRGKKINSEIPMLHYVVWKEIVERPSARNKEIADIIGCGIDLVDKVRKRYKNKPFYNVPIAKFNRKSVKRIKMPENPYSVLNENFLIRSINRETMDYIKRLKEGL